ncbi:MAG: hypothetical protein WBX15_04815 [Thermoanaerobaculia bacterium]
MRWKRRGTVAILFTVAALVILSLLLFPACCCVPRPPANDGIPRPAPVSSVGYATFDVPKEAIPAKKTATEMRNVLFRIDPTIILHVHELLAEMHDKEIGTPLNFDDPSSFVIEIAYARVGVDGRSLTDLMNHYVFNYPGAPLRDLTVSMQNGQLKQEGIIHKVIDIPFSLLADVSVTPGGEIRLHPTSIRICGLNGKGLMKAVGISLEKFLDLSKAKGVRAEKNDLLLDPLKLLPPPAMEGTLTGIEITPDEMVQIFGSPEKMAKLSLPVEAKNYMFFKNGTLRMGKLFMVRAEMEVIDTDPSDPFDFFLAHYNNQLVAGFTRNLPDYGLAVHMRDFADLGKPRRPGEELAPGEPGDAGSEARGSRLEARGPRLEPRK